MSSTKKVSTPVALAAILAAILAAVTVLWWPDIKIYPAERAARIKARAEERGIDALLAAHDKEKAQAWLDECVSTKVVIRYDINKGVLWKNPQYWEGVDRGVKQEFIRGCAFALEKINGRDRVEIRSSVDDSLMGRFDGSKVSIEW